MSEKVSLLKVDENGRLFMPNLVRGDNEIIIHSKEWEEAVQYLSVLDSVNAIYKKCLQEYKESHSSNGK